MQISFTLWYWKKFENRPLGAIFDEVGCRVLGLPVRLLFGLHVWVNVIETVVVNVVHNKRAQSSGPYVARHSRGGLIEAPRGDVSVPLPRKFWELLTWNGKFWSKFRCILTEMFVQCNDSPDSQIMYGRPMTLFETV